MNRKRLIIASLLSTITVATLAGAVVAMQAGGPALSRHDQEELMLSLDATNNAPIAVLTSASAASLASTFLGRSDTPTVLHGRASRVSSEPPRTVWIVLYQGGEQPPGSGPMGATNGLWVVDLTGVIIDDQTGEILRGFGMAHQ